MCPNSWQSIAQPKIPPPRPHCIRALPPQARLAPRRPCTLNRTLLPFGQKRQIIEAITKAARAGRRVQVLLAGHAHQSKARRLFKSRELNPHRLMRRIHGSNETAAKRWLLDFRDRARLAALFAAACHWRDILAFTRDLRTTSGASAIAERLAPTLAMMAPKALQLAKGRTPSRSTSIACAACWPTAAPRCRSIRCGA